MALGRAGSLRERVTFYSRTAVDDGYGNKTGDWAEEFTVAADILPLSGGESVIASRLTGTQPNIIMVRASANTRQVTAAWRAKNACTGQFFNIAAPPANRDQRGRFLDIMAVAGEANG